jgi:hypothetical protein
VSRLYNCSWSSLCQGVPASTLGLIRQAFESPGEAEAMLNLSRILASPEAAAFNRSAYDGLGTALLEQVECLRYRFPSDFVQYLNFALNATLDSSQKLLEHALLSQAGSSKIYPARTDAQLEEQCRTPYEKARGLRIRGVRMLQADNVRCSGLYAVVLYFSGAEFSQADQVGVDAAIRALGLPFDFNLRVKTHFSFSQ